MIVHPVKGLPDNVEASKNAQGLSIENVFNRIQRITVDRVVGQWFNLDGWRFENIV